MSDGVSSVSTALCLRCRAHLEPSGFDPVRHICSMCGQNYLLIMQLVPVDPARLPMLPQSSEDEDGAG